MATGNIDCNISDGLYFNNHLSVNIFNSPEVSNCNNMQIALSMQSPIPNINDAIFDEESAITDLAIELQNECMIDNNENCFNALSTPLNASDTKCENVRNIKDDNITLHCHSSPPKAKSPSLSNIKEIIPEELFINVESEDEGIHSWRPNMSSSSLCHDFFMPPENFQNNTDLPVLPRSESNDTSNVSRLTNETLDFQNSANMHDNLVTESSLQPLQPMSSSFKIDIKSHLRSQMAGLNTIRYEVINARRKANDLKEGIQRLKHKLNERIIVQRALDVDKLKEENDKLSLECQCLCMEVDHYLKGKAPLGEIDENFYRQKSQSDRNPVNPEVQAATQLESDDLDQEESKKWECHECTFVNHPLIKSCEMCHTPRLNRDSPLYASHHNLDSCYCHPQKHSS